MLGLCPVQYAHHSSLHMHYHASHVTKSCVWFTHIMHHQIDPGMPECETEHAHSILNVVSCQSAPKPQLVDKSVLAAQVHRDCREVRMQ